MKLVKNVQIFPSKVSLKAANNKQIPCLGYIKNFLMTMGSLFLMGFFVVNLQSMQVILGAPFIVENIKAINIQKSKIRLKCNTANSFNALEYILVDFQQIFGKDNENLSQIKIAHT
ncbi:hypothetical protein COBT_001971 [Conglomerata obtusa]